MLLKKTTKQVVEVDHIKDIKCDGCRRLILKMSAGEEKVSHASLMFSTATREEFEAGDVSEASIRESTDLCLKCYKDVLTFLKEKGGKVPSFFRDDSALVVEDLEMEFDV